MDDWQLLQNYVERDSETAFRTLVNRYVSLVYSVALRQVRDAQLAEEVAQAVFILLARKARGFRQGVVLSGWLFRTARFVASRAVRTEQRRQHREQEAFAMQQLTTTDDTWKRISPALDEALEHLGETDRNAVLLRFFNDKSHRETAAALGVSEEAAKKRVTRALGKLRDFFAGRGVTLSATVLASAVAANAAKAATPEIAASVSAKVIAGGAAGGGVLPPLVSQTLNAWRWAKLKLAGAGIGVGAAAVALVMLALPKGPIQSGGSNLITETVRSNSSTSPTESSAESAVAAKKKPSTNRAMRFRIVAADNDEPAAYARVAVNTVTSGKWEARFDFVTDETGVCELPLPAGLGRMDAGTIASGWEGRFMTWRLGHDGEFPADYTLRVQRVTNSIGGWLRDEAGKPVAGAEIWMQFGGGGDASWRETPRERPGFFDSVPVTRSDNFGRWSCAVIPPENDRYYRLEARHADFAPTDIESCNATRDDEELKRESLRQLWAGTLVITLRHGVTLAGRVTDQAGQPISEARIFHHPETTDARIFKTDANGKFTVTNLAANTFPITVTAPGFAPEYRAVEVRPEMEPLNIQLGPGARLRLLVVDENGVEVPDATVGLQRWGEHRNALKWEAQTGPDGRVEWSTAPPNDELELFAGKNGWCYTRYVRAVANATEHTIKLQRALKLNGYVTDADTGTPIAEFKAFPGYGEGRGELVWKRLNTERGENGSFKLTFGENRQPWRVRIEAEGYEPATSDPLPPDFTGTLEIKLKPAAVEAKVRGVVLLPDGTPAASAQVALLTLDYGASLGRMKFNDRGESTLTNTDLQGAFAFSADPRAHSVAAVHPAGFAKLRVQSPNEPVALRLNPWGRIEGSVADAARAHPIDSVALMDDTAILYPGAVTPDLNTFAAKLDAAGRFSFEQVPPGRFSLYLNRGMGIPFSCQTEITVRAGETAVAQIVGKGRTVIGRFRAKPGQVKDWVKQTHFARLGTDAKPPPAPPVLTEDAVALWAVNFWQSEAGHDYDRQNRAAPLIMAADGSFRADEVEIGDYKLTAMIGDVYFTREVRVQDTAGTTNELDIGTLELPSGAQTQSSDEADNK